MDPELVEILKAKSFRSAEFVGTELSTEDGKILLSNIEDGNLNHMQFLNLSNNIELCPLTKHLAMACEQREIDLKLNTETKGTGSGEELHLKQLTNLITGQVGNNMVHVRNDTETAFPSTALVSFIAGQLGHNLAPAVARNNTETASTVAALASNFTPDQVQNVATFISKLTQEQTQCIIFFLSTLTPDQVQIFRALFSTVTPEQVQKMTTLAQKYFQVASTFNTELKNVINLRSQYAGNEAECPSAIASGLFSEAKAWSMSSLADELMLTTICFPLSFTMQQISNSARALVLAQPKPKGSRGQTYPQLLRP